jgi:hypothetical protein
VTNLSKLKANFFVDAIYPRIISGHRQFLQEQWKIRNPNIADEKKPNIFLQSQKHLLIEKQAAVLLI